MDVFVPRHKNDDNGFQGALVIVIIHFSKHYQQYRDELGRLLFPCIGSSGSITYLDNK